jgi:hypothetical protein
VVIFNGDRTRKRAELMFVRVGTESGHARTERFSLSWDEEKVGSSKSAASQSGAQTSSMGTVR